MISRVFGTNSAHRKKWTGSLQFEPRTMETSAFLAVALVLQEPSLICVLYFGGVEEKEIRCVEQVRAGKLVAFTE